MTSKSFKGLLSANELNVVGYGDSSQVDLLIRRSDRAITSTGIAITPSDAPALALAILEAAGVVPVQRDYESYDDGTPEHLQAVAYFLKQHNEAHERATAEAKEQAELEAEALELYRTFYCSDASWVDVFKKETWLAVARRAREMAKEAPSA